MISYLSAQIIMLQQLKEIQTKTFWFQLPFGRQNLILWYCIRFKSICHLLLLQTHPISGICEVGKVVSLRCQVDKGDPTYSEITWSSEVWSEMTGHQSNVMCPMCLSLGLPCTWPLEYGYLLGIPSMIIDGTESSDTVPKTATSNIPPPHLIRMNCQR